MQIVDCPGAARDRGRAHGETLRDLIADALDRWSAATLGGPGDIDAYCARLLGGTRHASGQHYAIATRQRVLSVECSAGGCADLSLPDTGRLLHTNHPLASRDIAADAQTRLDRAGFTGSSHRRLDWLADAEPGLRTARDVKVMLDDADAPLCLRAARNGDSQTFASVLYEMTDAPHLSMRADPAGQGAWAGFELG